MNWRSILTVALLVIALAAGWAIIRQRASLLPTGEAEARPDYILHDFEIITLNKEGGEGFTLQAPKLARTPGNHEMNIDQPTFLFPDRDGTRWRSRSATGWVNGEGDEVRLRGNVILDNPKGGKQMRVETDALNVYPNANRATSDQQVTVTQPGATLSGRGMVALLDENRVTLNSDVRVRYAPSIR